MNLIQNKAERLRANRDRYAALTAGEKIKFNQKLLAEAQLPSPVRRRVEERQAVLLAHYTEVTVSCPRPGHCQVCTSRTHRMVDYNAVRTLCADHSVLKTVTRMVYATTEACPFNPSHQHHIYVTE